MGFPTGLDAEVLLATLPFLVLVLDDEEGLPVRWCNDAAAAHWDGTLGRGTLLSSVSPDLAREVVRCRPGDRRAFAVPVGSPPRPASALAERRDGAVLWSTRAWPTPTAAPTACAGRS